MVGSPYLINMSPHYKYGSLGGVNCHRVEPEVESRVFVTESYVPQQQIHSSIRQEKLKMNPNQLHPVKHHKYCNCAHSTDAWTHETCFSMKHAVKTQSRNSLEHSKTSRYQWQEISGCTKKGTQSNICMCKENRNMTCKTVARFACRIPTWWVL